jgi:adenylate cyclase
VTAPEVSGESGRATRRLTAILAADVAGYSRLMGADEEGTLAQLKAHRRELVDPKITEHRGRIVKTTGDGMLIEFASVVDALRCAVEVQRGMAERNKDVPQAERIEFRMGINVGDIIIEGGDIFGDGVNVAARLEGLAEPGGICVSGRVQEDAEGKLELALEDAGQQQLKNISRPVRVYRVAPSWSGKSVSFGKKRGEVLSAVKWLRRVGVGIVPMLLVTVVGAAYWQFFDRAPPQTSSAHRLSMVVLPFKNLGNDPEQEYFVEGITDDLTSDLSRIEGSFVIAPTTARAYKDADPKRVRQELRLAAGVKAGSSSAAWTPSSARRSCAATFDFGIGFGREISCSSSAAGLGSSPLPPVARGDVIVRLPLS